ncbi:P-loop containing nucleoside triphosphate hydrolase protein [Rhizodiscina lignyota]|uniref:P-loop containing nucleoside triphosphate hydrolase protein n=1 Tax=Rhizodiscina lignyota TaxID=1504668 RepID=A0A9P4I4Y2_9PEZI|nr:P-loop containing nucleoside triphosphate hydrolase protein [Rhizodiscina lignyota]
MDNTPRQVVLHRIFCDTSWHRHNQFIFEDEPHEVVTDNYRSKHGAFSAKLHGEKLISNLDSYIHQNPQVAFIVFREHLCGGNAQRKKALVPPGFAVMEASERNERLRIVSQALKDAITAFATCQVSINDTFNPAFNPIQQDPELDAPYIFFYHHRSQLSESVENAAEESREQLTLLRDFLESNYGAEYSEAEEEFKKGMVSPQHVKKLFKPNEVVIQEAKGIPVAHVLGAWPIQNESLSLQCWSWDFDGRKLTRIPAFVKLELKGKGPRLITELGTYPSRYASEPTLKRLTDRGRKFWSLKEQTFACYSGWDSHHDQQYMKNRFVIDTSTYKRIHRSETPFFNNSAPLPKDLHDNWPVELEVTQEVDDSMLMTFPSNIPGFEMQAKKWVRLNVEQIEAVEWNKKAFERLVLDQRSKELIRAIVTHHASAKNMGDIISGKGNGLIILLHGSPGVGKTLTAESVAELAEKPLYRVTCGDIGTDAQSIEKYLEQVLYLGKKWDCVLLMDEADVFLEERTMADIQRNSLVSVFLRILEFYDGILILTSNRVGTFDEAFKSRIQVALHYGPLTKKSRRQIWQNFLEMLEEEDLDVDIGELEGRLDDLAAEEMNGRQIRNCLLTAQQLARYKNERLGWDHLSQAIRTATDFQKYLKNIHGHNDEQWAREERLR